MVECSMESIEKQNRCVVCGREKLNGQPFKPNQTCLICDLDVPQLYREFVEKKKETWRSYDPITRDELCDCCGLDYLACFCPCHEEECNSQWRIVFNAPPVGYFFVGAVSDED